MAIACPTLGRRIPAIIAALALAACNSITGASDLLLADADDDGSGSQGAGAATGATSGTGGSASVGQGGSTSSNPQPSMATVEGVTISDIVLYQGVERPLMQDGAVVNEGAPIIAQRGALLRVFYSTAGYNGAPVTARLTIGETVLQEVVTLGGTSSPGSLSSTINFEIPPPAISGAAPYRVDLLQPIEDVANDNPAARFPSDENATESIPAQNSGVLKITLVPVQYNADGSGRLPDTSASQIDAYSDMFFSMYPVTDVEITVRPQALSWNASVSPNGSGWDTLLNAVADLRSSDGAASEQYYYGIFEPASSTGAYCSGGCVAGLGFIGGPSDSWTRAAIGLGYSGQMAVETALHELGHNHGRSHAPCGTSGDSNYPYSGAKIGVWGYDLLSGELYAPTQFVDFMSYCNPTWISDYNFAAIFNRVKAVSADIYTPPALQNLSYQRVAIDMDGNASWMSPITLARPPQGALVQVTLQTANGPQQTEARFAGYDHLDGGVLFVPPAVQLTTTTQLSGWIQDKWIVTGL